MFFFFGFNFKIKNKRFVKGRRRKHDIRVRKLQIKGGQKKQISHDKGKKSGVSFQ